MDWLREQHGEDRIDIFDPLDSASNEVNYDVEVTTLVKPNAPREATQIDVHTTEEQPSKELM